MAGLFDFKSAEEILKERQDATRKNVMEAFNQPGQYKVRGERTANAIGKALGLLGGKLFADSPEEQVAGQMQRANQLAQSLKPVEGESQSQFYNRVAVNFNDAGYPQNALKALTLAKEAEAVEAKEAQRQLERATLTKNQEETLKILKSREKREQQEANLFNSEVGATSPPANKSYKPGDVITNAEGKQVVVQQDRTLLPLEVVNARKKAAEQGVTYEPSQLEKTYNFLTSPYSAIADAISEREILGKAQMVSGALEKNIASPRDLDAMRDLVKLPQEESGLTIPQYNRAKMLVKANPE
jgi:hypothetical protein